MTLTRVDLRQPSSKDLLSVPQHKANPEPLIELRLLVGCGESAEWIKGLPEPG